MLVFEVGVRQDMFGTIMTPCWDDNEPCHFPLEVSRHRAGVFCNLFAS